MVPFRVLCQDITGAVIPPICIASSVGVKLNFGHATNRDSGTFKGIFQKFLMSTPVTESPPPSRIFGMLPQHTREVWLSCGSFLGEMQSSCS